MKQFKSLQATQNLIKNEISNEKIYTKIKKSINNLKSICDGNNININSNPNNIWLNGLNNFIIILMNE